MEEVTLELKEEEEEEMSSSGNILRGMSRSIWRGSRSYIARAVRSREAREEGEEREEPSSSMTWARETVWKMRRLDEEIEVEEES